MHPKGSITDIRHGFIWKRYSTGPAVMPRSGGLPTAIRLPTCRTDETDVPVFTLNRLDEPDGVHGKLEQVPYPKVRRSESKGQNGYCRYLNRKTTWVKTDYSVDQYIAWPFWTPDSKKLAIQVINRDQNDMKIILADPATR